MYVCVDIVHTCMPIYMYICIGIKLYKNVFRLQKHSALCICHCQCDICFKNMFINDNEARLLKKDYQRPRPTNKYQGN